jgi:hypothetical protein
MLCDYFQTHPSCLKPNISLTFYDHFWILVFYQDNPWLCRQYYKLYKGTNVSLWLWGHEMNLQVSDLRPEHEGNTIEGWRTSLYDFSPHYMSAFTFQADSFECFVISYCLRLLFDYIFLIKFIVTSKIYFIIGFSSQYANKIQDV